MSPISCEQVDELAGAYALGAVDADEDRSISEHLATCDQPHVEARDLIGAGAAPRGERRGRRARARACAIG